MTSPVVISIILGWALHSTSPQSSEDSSVRYWMYLDYGRRGREGKGGSIIKMGEGVGEGW